MLKNKKMLIIIAAAIVFCLILLVIVIILFAGKDKNKEIEQESNIDLALLYENFDKMFTSDVLIEEPEEGTIYLGYDIQEEENGKYKINTKIPLIGLKTPTAEKINNEIKSSFVKKIVSVIKENQGYTIYKVDYTAIKNENIISLVLKCSLKEGNNPLRVIIQTYNYNIENDKLLTLEEIVNLKELNKEEVEKQIIEKVKKENTQKEILAEQGYNVFVRDIKSSIYKIENTKTYFLDENNCLYVIYAYGNTQNTSEMDLIIFE